MHWFSILNSLVIVFLLSGIVAMIMVRTLRRDLAEYNSVEEKEELLEESGWKLVHADVLRSPPNSTLLATSVGTGMQLLGMAVISICCAMLGFLSPANRGSMLTVTLLLFVLMGSVAGYSAAVTYMAFKGNQWKALTLLTAFLYPGIVFGTFFLLNFFIWGKRSSGAVPLGTFFALLCIWFLVSFPLVWMGVWLGYRRERMDPPVKTNMVPRVVPSQAWYLNLLFTMVVGGILPFGAVFIELYFIMSSVWLQVHVSLNLNPCSPPAHLPSNLSLKRAFRTAAALLLRLRLPRAGAAHPARHVRRDGHRSMLLPAVQRELQLAVAFLPQHRLGRHLPLRILLCVLLLDA